MTPEIAECYRLLLLVGIRDTFDISFDRALETEDPLTDLVLSLCTCISDNEQVLSVLREYTLNCRIDEQAVYNLVLEDVRNRYLTGKMTRADVSSTLYDIARNTGKFFEDPWYALTETYYELELYEDGYISEAVFNRCFDAWFFNREKPDPWQLQREENNSRVPNSNALK